MRFIAAVYEHAARIINRRPWEVSRDPDLLFEAHAAAFRMYSHSPVVPGIDIYNVEAEGYGAAVMDPGGIGVPSIEQRVCADVSDLCLMPPLDPSQGRFHDVLGVARRLRQEVPAADVAVPLSGPFSIASHLLGFEALLTGMVTDQESLRRGLEFLVENQLRLTQEIAAAGFDVMILDSAAGPPLLSPGAFHVLAQPVLQKFVAEARRISSRPVSLIIGGNTSTVVADLVATGADHLLCPAETDQLYFMQQMNAYPDPVVRINMPPAFFSGEDIEPALAEASRVLTLGKHRVRVCIGSGVLPYDADPDVVCRIRDFVEGYN